MAKPKQKASEKERGSVPAQYEDGRARLEPDSRATPSVLQDLLDGATKGDAIPASCINLVLKVACNGARYKDRRRPKHFHTARELIDYVGTSDKEQIRNFLERGKLLSSYEEIEAGEWNRDKEFFTEALDKLELDVTPHKQLRLKRQQPKEGNKVSDQAERAQHREFWTDHSKGWNNDVNKKHAHYQSRIQRETESKVNAFLKATGMKKIDLTDQALNAFIDDYEITDEQLQILKDELTPR